MNEDCLVKNLSFRVHHTMLSVARERAYCHKFRLEEA